jgi:hypothetical protein
MIKLFSQKPQLFYEKLFSYIYTDIIAYKKINLIPLK